MVEEKELNNVQRHSLKDANLDAKEEKWPPPLPCHLVTSALVYSPYSAGVAKGRGHFSTLWGWPQR